MTALQLLAAGPAANETTYRVTATRGGKTKQLGQVDAAHLDGFVAAERSALRGWRVEVHPETHRRRITGGTADSAGGQPATSKEKA